MLGTIRRFDAVEDPAGAPAPRLIAPYERKVFVQSAMWGVTSSLRGALEAVAQWRERSG